MLSDDKYKEFIELHQRMFDVWMEFGDYARSLHNHNWEDLEWLDGKLTVCSVCQKVCLHKDGFDGDDDSYRCSTCHALMTPAEVAAQ